MAKVVLKGLDYIELNIVFDNQIGKMKFLREIDRLHNLGYRLKTDFIGENFTKLPHRRNRNGRFELVSERGIYLDFSSTETVGNGFFLNILLLKPTQRSLPCLLWESPFETMKEILGKLEQIYGKISYSISEIHLCCHFTGIHFKTADSNRFFGLPLGPWHAKTFTGFNFKHPRAKTKRVEASLYHIGSRLIDKTNSFNPTVYYPPGVNPSQVWNLEFKIFKKFLNERKIYTLDDLEQNFSSLWRLLTTKKVRMIVKSKDSNKRRWKTNRHWKTLQNAWGDQFTELERVRGIPKREIPRAKIKKLETLLIGLASELDLWNKPLEERVKEVYGCFDIDIFSNEEMLRYRYERGF